MESRPALPEEADGNAGETYFINRGGELVLEGGTGQRDQLELLTGETAKEVTGISTNNLHRIFENMLARRPTKMYRETAVGKSLIQALDVLLNENKIDRELYEKTLAQFDRTMLHTLTNSLSYNSRMTFKAETLDNYNLFGSVWTFNLTQVEFREPSNRCKRVPRLRILAFDGLDPDVKRMTALRNLEQGAGIPGSNVNIVAPCADEDTVPKRRLHRAKAANPKQEAATPQAKPKEF